jgi:hypothetical protein
MYNLQCAMCNAEEMQRYLEFGSGAWAWKFEDWNQICKI